MHKAEKISVLCIREIFLHMQRQRQACYAAAARFWMGTRQAGYFGDFLLSVSGTGIGWTIPLCVLIKPPW
jgi:hypothetical protein